MLEPKPLSFRRYRPREGHPNWQDLHEQAVILAREIEPLIHLDRHDTFQDRAADRLRQLRSLATGAQNYRINRRRWRRGVHALRPLYFIWTMLYRCNFRCTYCDDHRGNHYYNLKDEHLDFADRARVLRTMRTGTSAVYFCGGEPTLVKELPVFTDMAFSLGYQPLMINTNAFVLHEALKRPDWHKWLRQIDIVIVSLDGLSVPGLKELWGVPRVEQVLINLLMLRELRPVVDFKLAVNAVVGPETIAEAASVLDFVTDLGDVWFAPVPVNYHGKDKNDFAFERDMIRRSDYQELAASIMARKREGSLILGSERLIDMLLQARPYTCLPTLRPHVDPDGRISWPCRGPKHVDPVSVNILDYENLDQCWLAADKLMSAISFHGPGPNQCGDNCAWAQNYTTARYHDFLTDPLHSGIVGEVREFAFKSQ